MFTKLAPDNQSDGSHYCVPLSELELGAKLVYYAVKTLEKITRLPIPPP